MSTSLETNFSQKLTLDPDPSSSSSCETPAQLTTSIPIQQSQSQIQHQPHPQSLSAQQISSHSQSQISIPNATTSGSGGGALSSFKNIGKRNKSPMRNNTLPGQNTSDLNHLNVAGAGGESPNHSRHNSGGSNVSIEKVQNTRVARKILNKWSRKTKDKTKDFIRRSWWKTLPENQDLENSPGGAASAISPPPTGNFVVGSRAGYFTEGGGNITTSTTTTTSNNNSSCSTSGFAKIKSFTKRISENEIPCGSFDFDPGCGVGSGPVTLSQKSSTTWRVHVWATYVQRNEDEITEEPPLGRDFLSEFQKVKLIHFLHTFIDMNRDNVISAEDFVALNQRIRHYIEWSSECIEFHILKEVHSGFLECFLNQPLDNCSTLFYCSKFRETKECVTIDEWLDIWGNLLCNSSNIEALPLWLQYFPKILFQVINKSGSGTISKEELRAFYTMFLGIDFRQVNETLDSIYNAMTDGGKNKIGYTLFKYCFANFLIAKHPHGPGQFLFGICCPQSLYTAFPIDYSALNTPKDDLEPYNPEKDKSQSNRRSVIV